jgi:hypothetical protein
MDAGDHHEDTSDAYRRQFMRRGLGRGDVLPRDRLLGMVVSGGFKRPTPKKWVVPGSVNSVDNNNGSQSTSV